MSNAYTGTTHQFSTPYLTLDEFKNAPTAIDLDNLVFNSQDPDVQDSELANVIARALILAKSLVNGAVTMLVLYRPNGTFT